MMEQILSLVSDIFLGVLGITLVFDGTRRLVIRDHPRSALAALLFGVVICASYSGMNFFRYKAVTAIMDSLEKHKIIVPPESEWSKDLTPENREAIREASARLKFMESGELVFYTDKEGNKKAFVPTEAEIRNREEMALKVVEIKELSYQRYLDAIRGALAGILAALIGLSAGRHSRRRASNSMIDSDENMRRSS